MISRSISTFSLLVWRRSLLGKPRLQPWPSQPQRMKAGFSPWGMHLTPRLAALATLLALASPAAFAQHASISVPTVGAVSLEFKPALADPRGFASIEISSAGHKVRFTPRTPIARIPSNREEILSSGLPSSVPGLSVDPSRLFFRGQFMSDSEPHTLLFFVSEGYASNASPLFVVGFTYMGEPYKVLQHGSHHWQTVVVRSHGRRWRQRFEGSIRHNLRSLFRVYRSRRGHRRLFPRSK